MEALSPVSVLQNYNKVVTDDFPIVPKGSQGGLNQDDFFKLLTVQLTSQDPLKPMEDTEFISQMTSFSSLSEMEKISADMKTMREQQEVFTTQSLIGKHIRADGPSGEIIEGIVTQVAREEGVLVPYVGDQLVDTSHILEISEVSKEITTQSLIGKHIRAEDLDGEIIEGVVTRVAREHGALVSYIGDKMVPSSKILEISEVSEIPSPEELSQNQN